MDYSKLKNAELEALLKERSLPHTGKKAEMVSRLQEHDKQQATSTTASTTAPAPASKPAAVASTEPAAAAVAAGGQERAANPVAVPNQAPAQDPSKAKDLSVAKDTSASTAAGTTPAASTDAKPAASDASIFTSNLPATDLEKELEKRKARAKKFGIAESDSEAIKALERAKRFGTGGDAEKTAANAGVGLKLDAALPERRPKKRDRADDAADALEDEGLKKKRGASAGATGRGGAAPAGGAPRPKSNGSGPKWMSDKDREAAEKRKARFAQS